MTPPKRWEVIGGADKGGWFQKFPNGWLVQMDFVVPPKIWGAFFSTPIFSVGKNLLISFRGISLTSSLMFQKIVLKQVCLKVDLKFLANV